jgi:hypothetical protein
MIKECSSPLISIWGNKKGETNSDQARAVRKDLIQDFLEMGKKARHDFYCGKKNDPEAERQALKISMAVISTCSARS